TLRLENPGLEHTAPSISRRTVSDERAAGAASHGLELLQQGFTVDQVVHDYGDLCQAVTELAVELEQKFNADEFRTLNRCLDDAIADAVSEYGMQRDRDVASAGSRAMNEKLGSLAHEIRNLVNTATLAFAVMKRGSVGTGGATAAVLDRSLAGLTLLTERALAEVRLTAGLTPRLELMAINAFIAEVQVGAGLAAAEKGCQLSVHSVEPGVAVNADRQLLHSAVYNLMQNAFKFSRPGSHISLSAMARDDRVLIDVQDQCGGLPPGKAEAIFRAFEQHDPNRSGVGLGLSIARRAVEACGGQLRVRDLPGAGCVFTIDLPRATKLPAGPSGQVEELPASPDVVHTLQ
ncbi:MAG TPA: HAMP domain-containing sensor histidine kinase, partial [Usitatibacter sp.]|nr:HAMP domain-containing sensor histidine kinase [Usitatibacter sp.]